MLDTKPDLAGAVGPAKLDKFDWQGHVERFLDHFDVVAKANGWSPVTQAPQLPTALSGPACDFVLPPELPLAAPRQTQHL